jgi:hypothetical protein
MLSKKGLPEQSNQFFMLFAKLVKILLRRQQESANKNPKKSIN